MVKWCLWFHFTIVDYYILQFDKFLPYKDIRRKALFHHGDYYRPLLENGRICHSILCVKQENFFFVHKRTSVCQSEKKQCNRNADILLIVQPITEQSIWEKYLNTKKVLWREFIKADAYSFVTVNGWYE